MIASVFAASLLAAAASQPLLVFHGNVVIAEDVYRTVLDLPADTKPTAANARSVAARLSRFLRKSGYELAAVRAEAHDQQIDVTIDEGRLDKIVILGGGVVDVLRAKLELGLAFDVFNRPQLERELRTLAQRFNLAEFAYELVPVQSSKGSNNPQLDELDALQELPFFRPKGAQELHILIAAGPWGHGLAPQLEIDSLQGGGLGAQYHNADLLLPGDRWRIEGLVAGAVRERVDRPSSYPVLSRINGGARYFTPSIADAIRPSFGLRADLLDRQRGDVGLESFQYFTFDSSLDADITPAKGIVVGGGLGFERRVLFGLIPVGTVSPIVTTTPKAQSRPHADLSLQLVFNPEELRRDRSHTLSLATRLYGRGASDRASTAVLHGHYQHVWLSGWNEFWLEGLATLLVGDVLFPEEESVGGGSALRGPFSYDSVRKLSAIDLEFRYSLWRDNFKIGLFHDLAAFGEIDRTTDVETARIADSFGLGFHALLYYQFQLDAWFGAGFASDGRFSNGAALTIKQAY